ncbi:MarR family transcriptional regulator [Paenibacillus sp. 1011MAR3C5]|uniref:MarR family winged helix-turn-helix transcriptional regulator n=1 Tax=Paenibacillus sp. 1011MAR3C5 TaxID=1675787 RepID=UPI000E6C4593|nr:MarR family transcriptional regulator [Paenibacillus sp. 1011MAR3C5]RJE90247.1 MarR family transcriptional regulator [Paenibacillus sp. 1011MAR3C5]
MPTLVSRFQRSVTQLNRLFASEIVDRLDSQVTGTQMYMLHYIRQSGRCRLTELAEKLDVKPSAVTVMIDRLVKSDYVVRTHDTDDRRVILVELTPTGIAILEKAQAMREEIVGAYIEKLNPADVQTTTEVLEKMVLIAQENSKCHGRHSR